MTSKPDYRITVETVGRPVRVTVNGTVMADSDHVSVMHETYLPSHPYYPKADVRMDLLEPSELRTFCPFKGTAHYWHINLPGGCIDNGAWSYEAPLPEARPVGGDIAFDPAHIEKVACDPPLPAPDDSPLGDNPLIDWVMRKAFQCTSPDELTEHFAQQLLELGMPLWRFNVSIWTLHPLLVGQTFTWRRGVPGVVQGETKQGMLQQPLYLNSPVRHVSEGLGGVRQRLDDDNPEFQFPVMQELRAEGGTDYVAMPLFFSDGQIHTITLASDDPAGFSTAHLGMVFAAITALARFFEVLILRHNTTALFDAYLGERTRHQILGGSTHRGDGENIRAAVLLCDMRDSTSMAGALPRDRYLGLLNDFFEAATEPVINRGGEVLKFIGDAVLSIFPVESGNGSADAVATACGKARAAAEDIVANVAHIETGDGLPPLRCAIGVHVGDVMYGNVGAPSRLDFTVTGSTVNVAARLSDQCKALDRQLLLSEDVARHAPDDLESLGKQAMRHVAEQVEVFALQTQG